MIVERTAVITVRVQAEVESDDEDEIEDAIVKEAISVFKAQYGLTVRAKDIIVWEE